MNLKRNQIINYALKYRGDYRLILKAIKNRESFTEELLPPAITVIDEDYPLCFWQLRYPPLCLFYLGDKNLLRRPIIGIVGSRQATLKGLEDTKTIVKNLKSEYYVVSGLAKGVDSCSHQAAIDDQRKTIGILYHRAFGCRLGQITTPTRC